MALLDAYLDPTIELDPKLSVEQLVAGEVERLQAGTAVVNCAAQIPRRLSEATREERALDKRRARRCLHVQRQCLVSWGGEERAASEQEQIAGAQMVWELWAEDHRVVVTRRLFHIATWAKRTDQLRFGKSAVVRLNQELEWMAYALRD